MGLAVAGVPHRKGGAQAAMDYLGQTAAAKLAQAA
jgi:alanine-glyoxylate transaminase/serine-glyoxylate transaminase/serine-pyruvate transaminase